MPAIEILPAARLRGTLTIPGDKSISHRAAILGLLAQGETTITNFLTAEDCLHTLSACEQLGAKVERQGTSVRIQGRGLHGLKAPRQVIDCGNSGTGVRLLAGVLAGQTFSSLLTGDAQVQRRPMQRVITPLTQMGGVIESLPGGLCPLRIQGGRLQGIEYVSPIASAQVKSCVLLAGLFAQGATTVIEPSLSRNHTELMLKYFGAKLEVGPEPQHPVLTPHAAPVTVQGQVHFSGQPVAIPADLSSAAFFIVAAGLRPGSELLIQNLGVNPTRTGLLRVLQSMGLKLEYLNRREQAGEAVADLRVIGPAAPRAWIPQKVAGLDLIPSLIDEIPVLAVAAAMAEGLTEVRNASELKVKETDRIQVLAQELRKLGIRISTLDDGLRIEGTGAIPGGEADSHGDHRLAMSLAVAGLLSQKGVRIQNPDCVNTSFPGFWERVQEVRA